MLLFVKKHYFYSDEYPFHNNQSIALNNNYIMRSKSQLILCLVSIIIFVSSLVSGQNAFEKYQKESIYLSNKYYVKNGVKHDRGLFNMNLKKELRPYKEAMESYKKYERNLYGSLGLMFVGCVALAAIIPNSENFDTNTSIILGTLSFGAIAGGYTIALNSPKHLHRSIWLRNGEILF